MTGDAACTDVKVLQSHVLRLRKIAERTAAAVKVREASITTLNATIASLNVELEAARAPTTTTTTDAIAAAAAAAAAADSAAQAELTRLRNALEAKTTQFDAAVKQHDAAVKQLEATHKEVFFLLSLVILCL